MWDLKVASPCRGIMDSSPHAGGNEPTYGPLMSAKIKCPGGKDVRGQVPRVQHEPYLRKQSSRQFVNSNGGISPNLLNIRFVVLKYLL